MRRLNFIIINDNSNESDNDSTSDSNDQKFDTREFHGDATGLDNADNDIHDIKKYSGDFPQCVKLYLLFYSQTSVRRVCRAIRISGEKMKDTKPSQYQ